MTPSRPQESAAPRQAAAWLNVAAKAGGAAVSFLLYVVLARTMTPEGFADVAVIFAWLALVANFACFSSPFVLVRFVPDYLSGGEPGLARGVLQFTLAATMAVSAAIAGLGALAVLSGAFAPARDLPHSVLAAAALLLPTVLLLDLAGLLMALKRAAVAELLTNVMRPALMVGAAALLWHFQRPPLPAPAVLAAYLAASLVVVLVCVAYALSILPRELVRAAPAYRARLWSRAAGGFMLVTAAAAVHERIDLLIMGAIAPPADVAAYAVAVRFAQTVTIAVAAVATVMAPHVVERLADLREGRLDHLQELVRGTARTALQVSLLALAGFALLGPIFLDLFGPHYRQAYVPLVILATGQALSSLAGPAAPLATLAGEPRIAIASLAAGIVVNASLNLALVPSLGGSGAALATAAGMVCAALIARAWVRARFGLDTSVLRL